VPPALSLLLLAFGPLLVQGPPGLLALLGGATAGAVWADGLAPGLLAGAGALAWGFCFRALRHRGCPGAAAALLWLGLWALPWIGAELPRRLPRPDPLAAPAAWTGWLWPAGLLAGPDWDPWRRPPLYEDWASVSQPPRAPALPFLLAAAAGLLYWRPRSARTRTGT